MTRYTEEDLIAYQLGEPCDRAGIRGALESDAELAALSVAIARTLRVFSAERAPEPDVAEAWTRLRATLPPMEEAPGRLRWLRGRMFEPLWGKGPALALLGMLLLVGFLLLVVPGVLRWRALERSRTELARSAARPRLTPAPVEPDDLPLAQHMDRAERWLTEVSHSAQPLDETARTEAQGLLLQNALYVRTARERGDLPDAAVLERLGRVLTAVSHDRAADGAGWHLRLEMNTDGLLFEIRILRQNQVQDGQNQVQDRGERQ